MIVHGEVRPELQRAADAVLSTSQMAKYVDAHPEQTRFAILTECGLVVRLELEHPEKQFYKPCRLCRYMKATDLDGWLGRRPVKRPGRIGQLRQDGPRRRR